MLERSLPQIFTLGVYQVPCVTAPHFHHSTAVTYGTCHMHQGLVLPFSCQGLHGYAKQGLPGHIGKRLAYQDPDWPSCHFNVCLNWLTGNGTSSKSEAAQDPLEAEVEAEAQSSSQQKQDQFSNTSKHKDKPKEKAKASDKDKRSSKEKDKSKRKRKSKDFEDLKSKLPPDLKTFDFNDFQDMDALKAKLDEFKLKKEGETHH